MGLTETVLMTYTDGVKVVFRGVLTIVVLHNDTLFKNLYCAEKGNSFLDDPLDFCRFLIDPYKVFPCL